MKGQTSFHWLKYNGLTRLQKQLMMIFLQFSYEWGKLVCSARDRLEVLPSQNWTCNSELWAKHLQGQKYLSQGYDRSLSWKWSRSCFETFRHSDVASFCLMLFIMPMLHDILRPAVTAMLHRNTFLSLSVPVVDRQNLIFVLVPGKLSKRLASHR